MSASAFYESLTPVRRFADAADAKYYRRLPDDWVVAVTDVVGSTRAIRAGHYKAVNMAGAAAISALMNVARGETFPFIFGGDGSAAAFPQSMADAAAQAMMATRAWVDEELHLKLRVGIISIGDIRKSGRDVLVSRFQAAPDVCYAMFIGGGVTWAEAELKAGRISLPEAARGSRPDLSGLSCRWAPIKTRNGVILSVLAEPAAETSAARFAEVVEDILGLLATSPRSGHPVPADGPDFRYPGAEGTEMEISARKHVDGESRAKWRIRFEMLMGMVMDKTGIKLGGVDIRRYRRLVSRNSDFQKFEDGLCMTVDVEPAVADKLETILKTAEADGILHYGTVQQDAALMTCIVPSIAQDDHMHFIDGAGGGYAAAASRLKLKQPEAAMPTATA